MGLAAWVLLLGYPHVYHVADASMWFCRSPLYLTMVDVDADADADVDMHYVLPIKIQSKATTASRTERLPS